MAISASRVTRFGIGGGIWRPAGDFSTKEPGEIVVVEEEKFTGGFFFDYERELAKREREKKRREEEKAKALKIQNELEKKIALEFRLHEEEAARLNELKRVTFLAEQHKQFIADNLNEKILASVDRAITKGNYSALEALDRQLYEAFEEETFMLEAFAIIMNQ